ncbi:ABC-2 type transport system permease protein [Georgenia soli]|uniref:ABC-2 type transport system permease protein n=1 Tax=Georgenia soli TaxID=638953 RepID=A0A2A9ESD6_9MICO|nr:ABC transporter permease [Georgenia soli]PFG41180.1 ABC-2 type transport system permease protein [Georgenia soli]
MEQLWTMTVSDLRQRVRDRSVIIFAVVVPLALMVVFNLVFGGTEELELEPVTVAAAVPDDDELGRVVVAALGEVGAPEVTVQDVDAAEVRGLAEAGTVQLGIVVPEGFSEALARGEGPVLQLVEGDDAGIETDILVAVVQGVLDQLAAGTAAAAAAGELGLTHEQVATVARQAATAGPAVTLAEGEASDEQLSGGATLVAGQAGLFLLFTVGFGVLSLVAEREQGTLARLRSMPMRPGLVVAAKALVGFVLGVVATTVLLVAGSLMFGVNFGAPLAVGVLVVCAVTAATSLMLVVARLARTAEQANIVQSILAIALGTAAGAFFPLTATGVVGQLLDLNPVAAFIRGLGITSGGGGLGDIGVPVAYMLGFAVVVVALSRLLPDRGREL